MNEADDAFDMILLVMVLAIFTPIMVLISTPFFKGDVGGFGVQIEKTALETEAEIEPTERVMTTDDVLLMLVVADRTTPVPGKIRLNHALNGSSTDTEISIDEPFMSDKETYLQTAKALMPTDMKIQLVLHAGPPTGADPRTGMRFWDVQPHP